VIASSPSASISTRDIGDPSAMRGRKRVDGSGNTVCDRNASMLRAPAED
jgi:hypothetical protein